MTGPRFATAPTPSRPNLLEPAKRLAAVLGLELMPHQEQIIGVVTEQTTYGRPVFTDSTVTMPRQAGKSMTQMILGVLQALSQPNQRIVYTSTTGMAARQMMLDEWVPRLRASELNGLFKVRATNGAERILFETGSSISLLSSSKHAGHGDTLHMILADELWCASDLIEQLRPTLITTGGVFLGFSTAGTPDDSPYLLARVEQGRRDVEAGVTSGRAYFEWSIDPSDIDDVEAYVAINPAVGQTVTADDIRNAVGGMPKVEAARSFGNIFTQAMHDPVIPLERWLAVEDPDSSIDTGLVFALDVSPDRQHASIGAAGRRSDDKWHVEVIESKDGVAWVPSRLRELVTQHNPQAVYVDSMTESFIPELEASGVTVERLHAQAHASAFGLFVDAVAEGTLHHSRMMSCSKRSPQPALEGSVMEAKPGPGGVHRSGSTGSSASRWRYGGHSCSRARSESGTSPKPKPGGRPCICTTPAPSRLGHRGRSSPATG